MKAKVMAETRKLSLQPTWVSSNHLAHIIKMGENSSRVRRQDDQIVHMEALAQVRDCKRLWTTSIWRTKIRKQSLNKYLLLTSKVIKFRRKKCSLTRTQWWTKGCKVRAWVPQVLPMPCGTSSRIAVFLKMLTKLISAFVDCHVLLIRQVVTVAKVKIPFITKERSWRNRSEMERWKSIGSSSSAKNFTATKISLIWSTRRWKV